MKARFIVIVRNERSQVSTEVLALEIEHLENKVDELTQLCDELKKKYTKIQSDRELWLAERARLMEKNKMIQTKVEAMITRLKALGQE